MTKVFVHVGMPKTGTTFLQQVVFPNLQNIAYLGKANYGHLDRDDIVGTLDRIARTNPILLDLQREREQLESAITRLQSSAVLISHERLFGNMNFNFFDNSYITSALRTVLPEAHIILVVRRQDHLLESLYRQSLRNYFYVPVRRYLGYSKGAFRPMADFPSTSLTYPGNSAHALDLHSYAKNYLKVFGENQVTVVPYELLRTDQSAFLRAMFKWLPVQVNASFPHPSIYESYSYVSSLIALALNRFVRTDGKRFGIIPNHPLSGYLNQKADRSDSYPYAYYDNSDALFSHMDRALNKVNRALSLNFMLEHIINRVFPYRGNLISSKLSKQIMEIHAAANASMSAEFDLNLDLHGYF